jgi:glycosyltransferase involved in cell wall biosynthesis
MSRTHRRISLNGLFLDHPFSGTWTYTRNLAQALPLVRSGDLRLVVRGQHREFEAPAGLTPIRPIWPLPSECGSVITQRASKAGWEQLAWPAASRGCDLLHSLYFCAPFVHPGRLVVTVHDAISMRTEFQHSRAASIYANAMTRAVRRADAIITVSEHAKSEICRVLIYPPSRVFAIHEAPDPNMRPVTDDQTLRDLRARYRLEGPFVLYLGGTEARKNIETLVRAWADIDQSDVQLVVVGRFRANDPLFPDIPEIARALGVRNLVFVPWVDQADLPALYSAAMLFCYPSRYEGFGLPPLEAMACGTPTLASNGTSLPEVLGDGAELIDPQDVMGWQAAVERALHDEAHRDVLRSRGSAWVQRYSWDTTAKLTSAVYDLVLGDA